MAVTISNEPWANFAQSDYSLEQWIKACLLVFNSPPKKKGDCGLPVYEPDGELNRNGVHAAAAALAGARGGINATPEAKRGAARRLISCYSDLNEDAPPSIKALVA